MLIYTIFKADAALCLKSFLEQDEASNIKCYMRYDIKISSLAHYAHIYTYVCLSIYIYEQTVKCSNISK